MTAHFSVYRVFAGLVALSFTMLACRPVIAIGWGEFILLTVLVVVLLGPVLLRVYRILYKIQKESKEKKGK